MAVFDENTNVDVITANDLVGEDKKFKTVDDLARGKAEADRVIQARERELAELREELAKRTGLEEVLERLKTQNNQTPPDNSGSTTEHKPAAVALSDEDLERRIEELTAKKTEEQRIKENVAVVANRLIEEFGSEDKANE